MMSGKPPCAAAAIRNREAILLQLQRKLPPTGTVLEIASGTGQHVAYFAEALPLLEWQPSDLEPNAGGAIRAYVREAGVNNVADPLELDVVRRPWPVTEADAVLCINMIHIAPWEATPALLAGAADVLRPGSMLHLYGPFMRSGKHTAPSNAAFDASLRERDARWGLRDLDVVAAQAAEYGFGPPDVVEMPTNNLFVSFVHS
jgi:SAM-dependent methyltransferase